MKSLITDDQWRDIRTLHDDHKVPIPEAVLIVTGPKTKVRAPTMTELTKYITTQRNAAHCGTASA